MWSPLPIKMEQSLAEKNVFPSVGSVTLAQCFSELKEVRIFYFCTSSMRNIHAFARLVGMGVVSIDTTGVTSVLSLPRMMIS